MSAESSSEKPYFTGMEKIRFLYLLIKADQADSLPLRQSRTSCSSGNRPPSLCLALPGAALMVCRLILFPARTTLVRSKECGDPESQVRNCPPGSLLPPG